MKTIGQYLKEKREVLEFSMEYVAQELNISYPSYRAYEANKTNLLNPRFLPICILLKIDPCDLIKQTTNLRFSKMEDSLNLAKEREVEYISQTISELRKELRERDETIGALKYQQNQSHK